MGNICSSCCKEEQKSSRAADDDTSFHNDPGAEFTASILQEFDMTTSVFEGASVYQKFTSRQTYEPRFVWINLETRTIHMSLFHNSKERRHKEASLADVTSVEKRGPTRVKNMEGNISSCLTVNFQRGGGIDLRFTTDEECDLWCTVLNQIVNHIRTVA
jgi:Meiotic cell cortex C-terminal pleckstrin homology